MYNINVCYKYILEAMIGEDVLKKTVEQMSSYTGADVFFVSETGRILACACTERARKLRSVQVRHLTVGDYAYFFEERTDFASSCCAPVSCEKRICGYVILHHETREEQDFFEMLAKTLAEMLSRYFEESRGRTHIHMSLRESVFSWSVFQDDFPGEYPGRWMPGRYLLLVSALDSGEQPNIAQIRKVWKEILVYEEERHLTVILYHLPDSEKIYDLLSEIEFGGCVSELFDDLSLCRKKQGQLKRLIETAGVVCPGVLMRERDGYLQGVFACTLPMIREAGLKDYRIVKLKAFDLENHTELYHTLKTYLICENNVSAAAKALHIHRNTMVYRLKQIKAQISIDINDMETSRELLAMLLIDDLSEQMEG